MIEVYRLRIEKIAEQIDLFCDHESKGIKNHRHGIDDLILDEQLMKPVEEAGGLDAIYKEFSAKSQGLEYSGCPDFPVAVTDEQAELCCRHAGRANNRYSLAAWQHMQCNLYDGKTEFSRRYVHLCELMIEWLRDWLKINSIKW